jgi:hypothetical protein
VDVDLRWAAKAVIAVCLAALVVTGAVLLVSGLHTNSQINALHDKGVPVEITVTGCLGLMGGTGSQLAGYSCTGTYVLDGVQYTQAIPGLAFHAVGHTVAGVAVPGDPKLLSTPDQVASQHASWRVFLIPGILFLIAIAWVAELYRRRPRRTAPAGTAPVEPR